MILNIVFGLIAVSIATAPTIWWVYMVSVLVIRDAPNHRLPTERVLIRIVYGMLYVPGTLFVTIYSTWAINYLLHLTLRLQWVW